MKTASAPLLALLATRQYATCDLITLSLLGGWTYRYTSLDRDVTWDGQVYSDGNWDDAILGERGQRTRLRQTLGLAADVASFTIIPRSAMIGSLSFAEAVMRGLFDEAGFEVMRAFMASPEDDPVGVIPWFAGTVGEITAAANQGFDFEVRSLTAKLDNPIPRNLVQSSCNNVLFDAGCGLNRASYAVAGTAASGSSASSVRAALPQATGYFSQGSIHFTTGPNAGQWRTVRQWTAGGVGTAALLTPLPSVPDVGDAFTIYPGCTLTRAVCNSRFSNLANFRGFPFVPDPELAV